MYLSTLDEMSQGCQSMRGQVAEGCGLGTLEAVFGLKGFVTLSARPSCGQGWDPTPDTQDLKVIQVHEHRCGF